MENVKFFQMVTGEVRRRGLRHSVNKWMIQNEFRYGHLRGKDQFGNEYFENKDYPYGRSRWVEVGDFSKWETFDSSKVPAEWHSWLHFMSDETPHEMENPMVQKWRIEHEANKTGTSEAYMGPEFLLKKHNRKTGGVKPVHTADGGIAFAPKSMAWDPNKDVEAEIKAEPNKEFKSFIESQRQQS